ncbi:MAG: WYL domain-containing protein [Verrucomicrobiota bacterium]
MSHLLECSESTIARIIAFLRDFLRFNPEYIQNEHRWVYNWSATRGTPPTEIFPPGTISDDYADTILARNALDLLLGNSTAVSADELNAINRLNGDPRALLIESSVNESFSFYPETASPIDPETFRTIKRALLDRKEISFHYRRLADQKILRTVRPYHVTYLHREWKLIGLDCDHGDITFLEISRMECPIITSRGFSRPPGFIAATVIAQYLGSAAT